MANIDGGVTGRPSGKLANIVFGAARTREGKQVTARELVKPSNPQTPAQTDQRNRFKYALDIVKALGPSVYQDDWNRAVGQLPGFQSLQSIFTDNMNVDGNFSGPSPTPLGELFYPPSWSLSDGPNAGEIDVTWDTATEGAADGQDTAVVLAVPADLSVRDNNQAAYVDTSAVRSDGALTFTGLPDGEPEWMALYFRSATAQGPALTQAEWEYHLAP